MAYTYDDFVSAANSAGLMKQFTDSDLQIAQNSPEFGISMLGILKDGTNATTAEQKLLATEAANQLRKTYGSFGQIAPYNGTYDSQIKDLIDKTNNYGAFQYGNETAYQKLLESVTNPEGFQYDPETDPMWSAYKKASLREGERASANALAQASAASGGRASSYALTAAQQAANYYASQLGDLLPTLQQNAYQQYLSEFEKKISSLDALQSDRGIAYDEWLNNYNMLQTALGNLQSQNQTEYQQYLNAMDMAKNEGELTPDREVTEDPGNGLLQGALLGALGQQLTAPTGKQPEDMGYQPGTNAKNIIKSLESMRGMMGSETGIANSIVTYATQGRITMDDAEYMLKYFGYDPKRYLTVPENEVNADNRVLVGDKYLTWSEILEGVNNGTILEEYDEGTGKYRYAYAPNKGSGGQPVINRIGKKNFATTQMNF